jgi:hypothetical protein
VEGDRAEHADGAGRGLIIGVLLWGGRQRYALLFRDDAVVPVGDITDLRSGRRLGLMCDHGSASAFAGASVHSAPRANRCCCSNRTTRVWEHLLTYSDFRHRAIQWMIDPPHDGGLGLDIQSTAHIAGHHDGGYLVCSTYSKLAEHRALARARRAMDAYQQRAQDPSPHPPKRARMT